MSDSTRRGFLKTSGVVAAGVTVGAAVASTQPAQARTADASAAPTLPDRAEGALVAYVTDVRSGTIAFMVEGHEVTVTDHDLVARLATAMHTANLAAAKARFTPSSPTA